MLTVEHERIIKTWTLRSGRVVHLAHCTCGWKAPVRRETEREAEQDYGAHGVPGQIGLVYG